MSVLPSFLEPWVNPNTTHLPYKNAIFKHKPPIGPVHALWWPCKQVDSSPDTVLLFIPGNPGLLDFYPPFLSALHDKVPYATKLAILAHAHVGHTPGVGDGEMDHRRYDITIQIQNVIEAFDAVKLTFGPNVKVLLLGHSVGCWIALQVLKARPQVVNGLFLLFPTISHIDNTPNGRYLSWLFRPPMPRIIAAISHVARVAIGGLSLLFSSWPPAQIMVLRSLLFSPSSIFAALSMAHDEMNNIRDLDTSLLNIHKERIWFYYAEKDDWVGEQREAVLRAINADPEYMRVVHGPMNIPHAFCINHGDQLATQCYEWLDFGGFLTA